MVMMKCTLTLQGYEPCGCVVATEFGFERPCKAGFKISGNEIHRLIYDFMLSRPEDYLSIYQSCCNHNCLKCHSWYFAQRVSGKWYSSRDIVKEVLRYREIVTVWESRERATMWHASDLCAHCGYCKLLGEVGPLCPRKLRNDQIILSPQGWGPARNIVSFTGGDLYCQPTFYIKTFRDIKSEAPDMWIHIESNGYGLTRNNLELLYEAGLDSIWLDLKAFDEEVYRYLCGTTNNWILKVPEIVKDLGIVLEVVLIYIPTIVEVDQIRKFSEYLCNIDKDIPVMIIAFFPEYKLSHLWEPTVEEMITAFKVLKSQLNKVKLGNIGVFCRSRECIEKLIKEIGRDNLAF